MPPPRESPVDCAWVYAQLLAIHPAAATAPLCVAFSGGEDSTALLGLLAQSPEAKPRLRAVHIDHGLQARSANWARACRRSCRALGVPLLIRRLSLHRTRGESLEALAREARYAALRAALRPGEVLLSAHHLEDQFETVLLQLLRGAGLPGLAAMPALMPLGAGWLARPLLGLPRARLREWVHARGLACVQDPSNADDGLDRNYLRHKVVPALLERWPGAPVTATRAARHLAEAQQLLEGLAAADVAGAADGADLSISALRALPLARRRNALRFWITQRGHPVADARRLEEIAVTLLAARPGANPVVSWGRTRVQRHAGRLILEAQRAAERAYELSWNLSGNRRLTLPGGAGQLQLVRAAHGPIDAALLPAQVTVRTRHGGERLRPRAGGPSRTLKSLLQAEAVPLGARQNMPLLFADGQLAAVADLWVDARWQAGARTATRLRLIWHRPA